MSNLFRISNFQADLYKKIDPLTNDPYFSACLRSYCAEGNLKNIFGIKKGEKKILEEPIFRMVF